MTKLIRLNEVMKRVGLDGAAIQSRVEARTFPAPVKSNEPDGAHVWREGEVKVWIDAMNLDSAIRTFDSQLGNDREAEAAALAAELAAFHRAAPINLPATAAMLEAEVRSRRSERTAPTGFIFLDRAAHFIAGDGVPGDGLESPDSVDEPRQRKYGPWRDALLRSARAGAIAAFDELSRAPAGPESASEDSLLRIDDLNRWLETNHVGLRVATDAAGDESLAGSKVGGERPASFNPQPEMSASKAVMLAQSTSELLVAKSTALSEKRRLLTLKQHEPWHKLQKWVVDQLSEPIVTSLKDQSPNSIATVLAKKFRNSAKMRHASYAQPKDPKNYFAGQLRKLKPIAQRSPVGAAGDPG